MASVACFFSSTSAFTDAANFSLLRVIEKVAFVAKRLSKIIVPSKKLRAVQVCDVRFQANCPFDLRAGIRDSLKMSERINHHKLLE